MVISVNNHLSYHFIVLIIKKDEYTLWNTCTVAFFIPKGWIDSVYNFIFLDPFLD